MSDTLKQELTNMIGPAQWFWLKPHVARDAIVIVNPQLELAEVGVAIATDNTQRVQRWIGEQLITKPTVEQLQEWERDQAQQLTSLIVQPYVLVQEKAA
ncbi:MAG: DUF2288 domain-containing protein [Cyanobacteria bacterium J06632_22]